MRDVEHRCRWFRSRGLRRRIALVLLIVPRQPVCEADCCETTGGDT
jgi:hypothetical protein